jgi:alginate O-acetyltransferase complex protein AlgI
MLFNSLSFILFFAVVFALNYLFKNHNRYRHIMLLAASYYFYAVWNEWLLLLIFFSTATDYFFAAWIEDTASKRTKKRILIASIVINFGILATFKYLDFFIQSSYDFLAAMGLNPSIHTLGILLPVGISFYTFQSISYIVDVYNQNTKAERSFLRYALYIAYFPQLVAGPIVRSTDFFPQLSRVPVLTREDFTFAVYMITMGLFKKVVLATYFAGMTDPVFGSPDAYSSFEIMVAILAFSLQIYFDFSGYSDTAIGLSRLLGITLPPNFNFPYGARNITEFWRRWHISLSNWLRDYVYIPLGGNRFGRVRAGKNLMLTMTLGGLWHGASWNFVIWGMLHGLLLVLDKHVSFLRNHISTMRSFLFAVTTFLIVSLMWLPFRADDFGVTLAMLSRLFEFSMPASLTVAHLLLLAFSLGIIIHHKISFVSNYALILFSKLPVAVMAFIVSLYVNLIVVFGTMEQPFIYFQF